MRIGFMGLGKLGFPCALAIASRGFSVTGYDISPEPEKWYNGKFYPYKEYNIDHYLKMSRLSIVHDLHSLVKNSDIIFVAIQTPHAPKYEGIDKLPNDRRDFDYSFLEEGVARLSYAIAKVKKYCIINIISTVLPGTLRRVIAPIIYEHPFARLCYNPFFIAMGTTIEDFLSPEFILLGTDDFTVDITMKDFYAKLIKNCPVYSMSIESAELTKVAYNTFIGMKIWFANTMLQICHQIPNANVDYVMSALGVAKKRLISEKYLKGGMGDGGACHPRDNIAMSYLANKLDVSNIFEEMMYARENYSEWLAYTILNYYKETNLPIVILGKTFKAESNITTGSAAILLANMLKLLSLEFTIYDPHVDAPIPVYHNPALYFIATNHETFFSQVYPKGSVIIDPWGYIPNKEGVRVIRLGRMSDD